MKKLYLGAYALCLLVGLVSFLACGGGSKSSPKTKGGGTGSPNNTNSPSSSGYADVQLRFIGRVDTQVAGGALLAWPGSAVQFAVNNAKFFSLTMQGIYLYQNNYVTVTIDDGEPNKVNVVDATSVYQYPLPSTGYHVVTVMKISEYGNGEILLSSVSVNSTGSFDYLPTLPTHLIEFIGDDVMCGAYVDATPGVTTCTSPSYVALNDPATENAANAYPVLTAKALGADWSVIARTDAGILVNYNGTTGQTGPAQWLMLDPTNALVSFNFQPQPDVVVVNLGYNDVNYWQLTYPGNNSSINQNTVLMPFNSTTSPANMQTAFTNFVTAIRSKYRKANIILTYGPNLSTFSEIGTTSFLGIVQTAIQNVVTAFNNAGDAKVFSLYFPAPSDPNAVTCDYLPSLSSHQTVAASLTSFIQQLPGWSTSTATLPTAPSFLSQTTTRFTFGNGENQPILVPNGSSDPNNGSGIYTGEFSYCQISATVTYNPNTPTRATSCTSVVGVAQESAGYCHIADGAVVPHNTEPPTSGFHYPDPWCYFGTNTSQAPGAAPRGRYIHAMEHGAVVMVYNCPNGCSTQYAQLQNVLTTYSGVYDTVILTADSLYNDPNSTSGNSFAAMSWNFLYQFQTIDENQLGCFIEQHQNYGRECVVNQPNVGDRSPIDQNRGCVVISCGNMSLAPPH